MLQYRTLGGGTMPDRSRYTPIPDLKKAREIGKKNKTPPPDHGGFVASQKAALKSVKKRVAARRRRSPIA